MTTGRKSRLHHTVNIRTDTTQVLLSSGAKLVILHNLEAIKKVCKYVTLVLSLPMNVISSHRDDDA